MIRDESKLRRYIELKGQIAELQEQLDELKGAITADLLDEAEERYELRVGNRTVRFGLRRRPTYSYSADLEGMMKELTKLKRAEELDGTAKIKTDSIFPTLSWLD